MGLLVLKKRFDSGSHANQRNDFMRMLIAIDHSKDSKFVISLLQKMKWPPGSTLIMLHVTTLDDEMSGESLSRLQKKKLDESGNSPLPIYSEFRRLEK